jgi:hypothetical protein
MTNEVIDTRRDTLTNSSGLARLERMCYHLEINDPQESYHHYQTQRR